MIGLLGVVLWCLLFRWWGAATTPVVVHLEAPAESRIEVAWQAGEAPLPLVPVGAVEDGVATRWTTELPPRPTYTLGLRFPDGVAQGRLSVTRVYRLVPQKSPLAEFWAGQAAGWQAGGFSGVERTDRGMVFAAQAGARLDWSEPVATGAGLFSGTALAAIGFFVLGGVLLLALVFAGLRFPERLALPSTHWGKGSCALAAGVFAGSAALFLHFVNASFPVYWLNDSTSYLNIALAWWQHGTFDAGGYEYELNRMPGYPWFAATALAAFGPELESIVRLQGLLAVGAFGALFVVVGRWLRPWQVCLAIPLVLLSPPVVWAARVLATESVFTSLWVLATAVFLQAWSRPTGRHWLWLTLFGLIVAGATLVRANAILLLALPGCAGVGCVWRICLSPGRGSALRAQLPVLAALAVPFAWVLLANGVLSWRNFEARGFARPSDLGPAVAANESFNSGMLDVRALADAEEYAYVVRERWKRGYFFPGWGLRHYRFLVVTDHYAKLDRSTTVADLAATVKDFAVENRRWLPWQARAVGWWRVLGWGLWLPERGPSTQDPLQQLYPLEIGFVDQRESAEVEKRLTWLARNAPRLGYTEEPGSALIRGYNRLVPAYPWIYRLLGLSSIGVLAWAAWRRAGLGLVLLTPFFLNVLLNVFFLYIVGRYVQVLDGMLILGWLTMVATARQRAD